MLVCRGVGKTWYEWLGHNRIHQGFFGINVIFLEVNAKKKEKERKEKETGKKKKHSA